MNNKNNMHQDSENLLKKIENQIWNSVFDDERIGLYTGLSGKGLFYYELYKIKNDIEYLEKLEIIIGKIDNLISEQDITSTFASGLAGYAWLMTYISGDLKIENSYFNGIDTFLKKSLKEYVNKNNFDLLHGSIGICLYFIQRNKKTGRVSFKIIVNSFVNKLIAELEKDIFNSLASQIDSNKNIYFGLAHGISSILNFLVYYCNEVKNDNMKRVYDIINRLIIFLNEYKYKEKNENSKQYYPNTINKNGIISESRLGWCQGDLGIGISLYNAGLLINNEKVMSDALRIISSTQKITLEESGAVDYILCHGCCGILLQYMFLKSKFNNNDYDESIQYWENACTLITKNFSEYETYSNNNNMWMKDFSLLEGLTGFGLVYSNWQHKKPLNWAEIFLLI